MDVGDGLARRGLALLANGDGAAHASLRWQLSSAPNVAQEVGERRGDATALAADRPAQPPEKRKPPSDGP